MKLSYLICVALLMAGCAKPKSAISDEFFDEVVAANPGLTDVCKAELRKIGMFDDSTGLCYEMLPPQRWKGVWNTDWEWSNFCPEPAATCGFSFEKNEVNLQFAEGAYSDRLKHGGMFAIEFVGRRSKYAGHYGHLDQYPQMIIVDRMISIRRLKQ